MTFLVFSKILKRLSKSSNCRKLQLVNKILGFWQWLYLFKFIPLIKIYCFFFLCKMKQSFDKKNTFYKNDVVILKNDLFHQRTTTHVFTCPHDYVWIWPAVPDLFSRPSCATKQLFIVQYVKFGICILTLFSMI